jgi:L-threonylcarbamoyladenylate synthase
MKAPVLVDTAAAAPGEAARQAIAALRAGRLIVIPTDTVYGLAGLLGQEEQIYRAKDRDRGKPIPILAGDVAAVRRAASGLSAGEEQLAAAFWPGPLTLVLQTPRGPEGFRVPAHELAMEVIRAAGGLLRVTSANCSGEPPALTAGAAVAALGTKVALALDAGPAPGGEPSTVARIEGRCLRILREGALAREAIMRATDGCLDE